MKCPKCGSDKVVEFDAPPPLGLEGMPKWYRGFDCQECKRFFRVKLEETK